MRINKIKPVRKHQNKAATVSNHRHGVTANGMDGDFVAVVT
jgi:hypothetical protein